MDDKKIAEEIKNVHINLAAMGESEEEHIARLFFGEIMENGRYGMEEVEKVLNNLDYPGEIREDIERIANVICNLRDLPNTTGRKPESYIRVMKRFLENS